MTMVQWSGGEAIIPTNINREVRWQDGAPGPEIFFGTNLVGTVDLVRFYKGRAAAAGELADRQCILRGNVNGSSYPEAGSGLGQYWAFMRLAEYYAVSGDTGAWDLLAPWLTWLDCYGKAEGPGWQFPTYFSEYGFGYGPYDPGIAASLALGCLYLALRTGEARAQLWARRILDDLRENRVSGDYGGYLYKSDYHYAWLNALVAKAFGLAVNGINGLTGTFMAIPADRDHFDAMVANFFQLSGNTKPNLLNRDGIPYSYVEDVDLWDYAPHYVFMRQMGSMEAVVLMASVALEYARGGGDWAWFDRLLGFILRDNLVVLSASQVRQVSASLDMSPVKNIARVRYGDYDRDNCQYGEARHAGLIAALGELPVEVDFRYGNPVITEDPSMARQLAQRLLVRRSQPREIVQAQSWLEGLRIELGDTVALTSDFHGFDQTIFECFGKTVNLEKGRVELHLARPASYTSYWAVDLAGGGYDAYALDQANPAAPDWPDRSYVY